jgi:hypothetical protein
VSNDEEGVKETQHQLHQQGNKVIGYRLSYNKSLSRNQKKDPNAPVTAKSSRQQCQQGLTPLASGCVLHHKSFPQHHGSRTMRATSRSAMGDDQKQAAEPNNDDGAGMESLGNALAF